MRLVPFSYFWICWKVMPSCLARLSWEMPCSLRCCFRRWPTWMSMGWGDLLCTVLAPFYSNKTATWLSGWGVRNRHENGAAYFSFHRVVFAASPTISWFGNAYLWPALQWPLVEVTTPHTCNSQVRGQDSIERLGWVLLLAWILFVYYKLSNYINCF